MTFNKFCINTYSSFYFSGNTEEFLLLKNKNNFHLPAKSPAENVGGSTETAGAVAERTAAGCGTSSAVCLCGGDGAAAADEPGK